MNARQQMTATMDREEAERVVAGLGAAQRRVILSLSEDWGKAACHQTARRMFWGIRGGHYLVNHKHRTDNCWCLNGNGLLLKSLLQREHI